MFAGKKSAQIREILISESAWEEMTCLFAPSLENYGYARSGKGGPAVAGVDHTNAIKSNTKRYESKTSPTGGNPSRTRKRVL